MTKTVATRLVESLIDAGFRRLYCLPGVQNDDFFDALYDHQAVLQPVHTRHEQGAAYMALGAALATGRPQACCVVPGPGFLNASTALATAWAVNAPVLMVVGETSARNAGKELGELHEIPDQFAILSQLTKWATRVDDGAASAGQIDAALHQLATGRPRPVGLEVPVDIWTRQSPDGAVAAVTQTPLDTASLERAMALIEAAERPLILVGSGSAEHGDAIQALARRIGAPVAAHRTGRGIMPASDPLSLLPPVTRKLWTEIDLVIGLGTRLGAKLATMGTDAGLRAIHIDIDPAELRRGIPADVAIEADLADALTFVLERARPQQRDGWLAQVAQTRRTVEAEVHDVLAPQKRWLDVLNAYLGSDGVLVSDLTQIGYAAQAMHAVERVRSFLSPGFQGTLGWSIATGLGAADACRDRKVVAIAGDGGSLFTIAELATARQHDIPLQVVVFTDNSFGNVRRFQVLKYGNRPIASDLENPDFVALARAFGLRGTRAETPEALADALAEGHAAGGPGLIEVPVGEFPSPWPYIGPARLRGA